MELEYGRPVEEVFVDITPEPLAAASLGQVLKLLSLRTHTEADQLFMYEKYVQVASDASRRGMKRPKSHRNKKMQGTTDRGGGDSLLCDPGCKSRLHRREREKKGEYQIWMGQK